MVTNLETLFEWPTSRSGRAAILRDLRGAGRDNPANYQGCGRELGDAAPNRREHHSSRDRYGRLSLRRRPYLAEGYLISVFIRGYSEFCQ